MRSADSPVESVSVCVHLRFVTELWSVKLPESGNSAARHRCDMKTNQASTYRSRPDGCQYALRREASSWEVTFEGRQATFKHELGALYVAYLLLEPPHEPIHGVALALNAREKLGQPAGPVEVLQERVMGLEDAAAVRALWRRQRELERVLADRLEIEPVKAEAQRELEEITEHLRKGPWLSRRGAERCARAVAVAIKRLHTHLAAVVDAEGRPDEVLRAFALHLQKHLLVPSGRGGAYARGQTVSGFAGCFIYQPPRGNIWEVQSPKSKVQGRQPTKSKVSSLGSKVRSPADRRPAAVGYLARFLCAGLALALLATGCAGPRPLKGGKAVITRKPAGLVEQTLVQSENPSQAAKQDQESVKVRTYTVPAGSRIEQSPAPSAEASQAARPTSATHQPSTISYQPSTALVLSAPMPVVEREETRARTELGAAQKDTARELGAKLASLKGMVWVGVGLFVFGLASLVWPPLKAVIASVTTSAALMLGGVALMVLPSLVVGNELLILGGVGVAVGGWFLAHRHGHLQGIVAASTTAKPPASSQGGS
jgi:hypothetical protein